MSDEHSSDTSTSRRDRSVAAERVENADVAGVDSTAPEVRPPLGRVVVTGVVVGLAIGFLAFFLVAMPIYMVRSIDLAGDARTFVRNGVLRVAMPVGVFAAVVGGTAVGRWRWNGGHLSETGRRDSPGVTGPVGR